MRCVVLAQCISPFPHISEAPALRMKRAFSKLRKSPLDITNR